MAEKWLQVPKVHRTEMNFKQKCVGMKQAFIDENLMVLICNF